MLLQALSVIGDEIAADEFPTKYVACTDADALSGNQEVHSVVVLDFDEDDDGLTYTGARTVDPEAPLEMAVKYGYVNQYNQYDHSLTQRATSSVLTELERMLSWPTDISLDDEYDQPLIQALGEAFDTYESSIEDDVERYDDDIEYKALLTVCIQSERRARYPGEIEEFAKATFRSYSSDLADDSQSASDSRGDAVCAVCDEETETFGLGAKLDQMYTSKKQWPFPAYNASNAWQSRPLCGDCILNIEVATDRFLKRQSFGAPGIRCRVIPYALPTPDGEAALRELIRGAREKLLNKDTDRPLEDAWNYHRKMVEEGGFSEPVLRLAFVHYYRDSAKAHGVGWIDGVSVDQIDAIREAYNSLHTSNPVFTEQLLVNTDSFNAPSSTQVFTGMWLFGVLCEVSDSDYEGNRIGDQNQWVDFTQSILTDTPIQYETLVSALTDEAIARYHERVTDEETSDYPYDGFHTLRAYGLLRVLTELGVLTDSRTSLAMKPSTITGEFTTLGDGLREFINAHSSISESPGRQAAFVLGAAAAQLSNWQQRRNLNRTFIQNRDVEQLTTHQLTRWQRAVWEKAKTYNAQAGNYGVPWADAEQLFHDAVLAGREEGWNTTNDELQYHFILGVNAGPRIAQTARANRDEADKRTESEASRTSPASQEE
ncbi:TM1802 family CRISPR-associated protein [Salinigranum halophilum]|uniref:TM1802 family CRISPR-associated protein n=1 Tax=Salinigranum halophilum TaxID=2565931 RepID=UPI0010A7CF61|nr:TM1802 family CRISPR-associated protein [Salinigranum halophilum]